MHIGNFFGHANVSSSVQPATTASIVILPANQHRTKIILSNQGGTEAWLVKLGPTATTADYTLRVAPSGNVVLDSPMHTGSVSAVQPLADGTLMITEFGAPE